LKIGIIGGTFNPIHFGHLRTVQEVYQHFNLEKIYFIPSAIPPHKDNINIASPKDRENMVRLAILNYPNFDISDIEIIRKGKSYTIETILELKKVFPSNVKFFFIIGIDAFLEIDTWKSYKQLFDHVSFIVMTRPLLLNPQNNKILGLEKKLSYLINYISNKISNNYIFNKNELYFTHSKKKSIFYIRVTSIDISSTQIRNLVGSNKNIKYLVPEPVSNYIYKKKLYK